MFSLFDEFFNDLGGFHIYPQSGGYEEKKCPVCGRTYSDFRKNGLLGCGECYNTFRNSVTEVLKQTQVSPVHTGKIPSKAGKKLKLKRDYKRLKDELAQAVKNEDYETAAKLHKQIRQMEGGVN